MSSEVSYTAETIDSLTSFLEASELLQESGIPFDDLETLEEMKTVLFHRLNRSETSHEDGEELQVNKLMRTIIEDDQAMRHKLSNIYLKLSTLIADDKFDEKILEELDTVYCASSTDGDTVLEMLLKQNAQLVNADCPIIVAGETSAGKSSFLNLLIGDELLPNSLLCATSTICRLVNDEVKKYTIQFSERGCGSSLFEEETLEPDSSAETLRQKLDKYVNAKDRENNLYKVKEVVIHWPIPILQGNVSIVDTPGVGEREEMTNQVIKYLPRAVAFIYIINSATAGGVQEDRLVRLLKKQIEDRKCHHLNSFDPTSAIFICNKWDAVPEGEKGTVDADTRRKLESIWPGFQSDQLFHLSITEALRYQKGGIGNTELYRKLLCGIKYLVPHSLELRVQSHHKFLTGFLLRLERAYLSRISHSKRSFAARQEKEACVRERLNLLRNNSYEIMESLREVIEEKERHLVERLHDHLQNSETRCRLLQWNGFSLKEMEDRNLIIEEAKIKIQEKIMKEINNWNTATAAIDSVHTEIQTEFKKSFKLVEEEFQEVSDMFMSDPEDEQASLDQLPRDHLEIVGHNLFNFSEKVAMGVCAPLLVPLAIFLPEIIVPFIAGLAIYKLITYRRKLQKYYTGQAELMQEWTKTVLDKLTKKVIRENIVREQLYEIHDVWRTYKAEIIPRRIEADEKLLMNLTNDQRTYSIMMKTYGPQLDNCKQLITDAENICLAYKY